MIRWERSMPKPNNRRRPLRLEIPLRSILRLLGESI